ncbi:MAG: DUF5715 family protein [Candidatus Korobacteraceae bacterium]
MRGILRRTNTLVFLVLLALPAFAFGARPASERSDSARSAEDKSGKLAEWDSSLDAEVAPEEEVEPLLVWTTTRLRGSRASLLGQNAEIDRLQLRRIEDEADLRGMIEREELVRIRSSSYLRVDRRLDPARHYCRPWVMTFLQDMGKQFHKKFRGKIQINSAVRTMEQQRKLMRTNRNAADIDGDAASSHLAGVTVDIAKKGLTYAQIRWIRSYLLEMKELGLVEAVEERWQAVFHIMVSDRYTEWRDQRQLAGAPGKAGSK